MKELYKRSISGFVFAVTLIGAILWNPWSFGALFFIINLFTMIEFYKLLRKAGFHPQIVPGITTGSLLFVLSFFITKGLIPIQMLIVILPILYLFPIYELFRAKKHALENIAFTLLGILYVALPFSLLTLFVFPEFPEASPYLPELLLILFLLLWSSDSGAYLFGVNFGKHKLYEKISPKKSWEGFFGGWLTALVAAYLISVFYSGYDLKFLLLMATIIVFAGTLGDLVESMYKRQVGVKDSGKFLPGHGGLLDRFDSVLFAAPFIYFLLLYFA